MSTSYTPGQAVIDLGTYGKLIHPVQVDGRRWYYYWDRSGDGSSADAGGLNGGVDHMTMDQLVPIFNKDFYLASNPAGNQVDFRYHYASLNGVKLSLPLHGEPSVNATISSLDWFGPRSATSIGSATAGVGSSVTNTSYDDLLAVWDAYNGISTVSGAGISGVPPLWRAGAYWSSTPWYDGYVSVHLGGTHPGYLGPFNNGYNGMVALEVLPSDEPSWEAALQLSFDTNLPQSVTSGGNARTIYTEGEAGQGAIYFDGDGDSLTITSSALSGLGDFLISFRMKSDGAQDPYSVLLSAGSGSWPNGNWINTLEISNNPNGGYVRVQSGSVNLTQGLNDGNWHQLEIGRQAGLVSVVVDGAALQTFYVGHTLIDLSTLLVGRWKANQLNDNNFRGYIDDLEIYVPSDTRTVWLQKSVAGDELFVDVIVNKGVSAHGVDFELDVPAGLTLEASSSNFSNTNEWTVLANTHSANRVSFIASAVDDSSGSALGVTSQDLVARLVFTMAPSASTAIVASEASYTLRIPTTAVAAYYETVPIASMPINAAPTGELTLTPPSEKSSATLATAAVGSAHVFWGYWYTPDPSNWANWTAPSITLNNSISGSTPLWIEATGSRSGMYNTLNDTRGDDTNAAGVRFDEQNPSYLGTVSNDQLNLPDGTQLGYSAPYGATLIGNPQLGWKPLFNPQGNGLGTVRQNEDFVSAKVTLNDLFGQTLSSGTKLFLAYADDDDGNPGTYNVSFFESLPGYRQGSTLEVSTAALADADGLGSFSYKWQSSSDGATWATIGGATTVALTLSQAEVGKYIRAQISYTDGGGTQEVITSSASTTRVANVNDPPTGQVTINGTAQQNATLTVSNTLADLDGIPDPGQSGALSYQWFADGVAINGATATTFSLDQSHVGKAISVRASYIDSYGAAETSNSAPTALVENVNDPVQGTVLINGTPARGQTLTASNTLTDVDGIPTAGQSGALTYQWFANTSPIVDAIASSFTLTEAQVGKTITVKVSYTDLGGTAESVTSAATPAVYNVNRAPAFSNLGGSVVFTKGGTAALIDSDATVSDPDAPANFDQATLSISRQGGANAQDSFGSTGYLGALSEGGSLTYDGATVGTVTQNSGGSLKLTFNSAATASVVNMVMQDLTYANSSAIPDHRAPLTWTFNDGNIGAQGMGGSAEAVGQVVVENVRTLSVSTTFWKSGAPLSGVDLTLVGVGLNGADDGKLIAKRVALVGSNLSFDLWTESTSTTSIAGYDVDTLIPASWSTAFEENVRTGWTVEQAQNAGTGTLAVSAAMSSDAANDLTLPAKLGSLDYTLPSGGNATEIIYTQWGVSTRNANSITASPMSDLYRSIAQAETANGQATINSLVPDAYNVVASAPLTTNRYITSADALSALKIAVGLSPNPGSTPVTVAQFAAADVDRSGDVNSADALNVLKMAVGLSTAPAKSWIWFTNSAAGTIVNTVSASVSDWMNDVVAPAESQTLQLVGVLRGDVDGSWTPPPSG
jgi:hypothetical protein